MQVSKNTKLSRVLSDPLRKNLVRIVYELMRASLEARKFSKEYISRLCYRKGYPTLENYTTDFQIGELQMSRILHSDESAERLINKVKFYEFCVANHISTPKVLGYTTQNRLFDMKQWIDSISFDQFVALFKQWIDDSPHQSIFVKPMELKGGVGAYRLDQQDMSNQNKLNDIYQSIFSTNYIIQQTIVQHEVVNQINPSAINTVRIDTYKPIGEPSRVMSALMRFGRKGYVVDNPGSSTGFFIPLDLTTHRLKAPGLQITAVGNHTYTHHPDTKIALDGIEIPYIDEVIALVNHACDHCGDRLVGWDVCIGVDGPILIEGNHNYHILMQELAYGGYLTHPEFVKVLAEEHLI
jgi:hypothetical protein